MTRLQFFSIIFSFILPTKRKSRRDIDMNLVSLGKKYNPYIPELMFKDFIIGPAGIPIKIK